MVSSEAEGDPARELAQDKGLCRPLSKLLALLSVRDLRRLRAAATAEEDEATALDGPDEPEPAGTALPIDNMDDGPCSHCCNALRPICMPPLFAPLSPLPSAAFHVPLLRCSCICSAISPKCCCKVDASLETEEDVHESGLLHREVITLPGT